MSTAEMVRLEFSTPNGSEPSFAGANNGTSVHFAKAGAAGIDYAIVRADEYCQSNPRIVTCKMPAVDQAIVRPETRGALSFPAAFPAEQEYYAGGGVPATLAQGQALSAGITTEGLMKDLGAVFGVGVDRGGNAYFGTYVKRHSPYGPAGNVNAIYRVTLGGSGSASTFITLGSATLPEHNATIPAGSSYAPYARDGNYQYAPGDTGYSNVYSSVGRAGIGDVDVTPDGKTLLAVEMTESAPTLWSVPINGTGAAATAGTPTSEPIPAPTTFAGVTCTGPWHPMGIGVRGSRVLIGGVCGGDEQKLLNAASTGTEAAAFVLERAGGTYTTIAATSLDYKKGKSIRGQDFEAPTLGSTGMWHNWYDGDASTLGLSLARTFTGRAMPMVANVEIMDNGDLVLGMRDRWQDQTKPGGTLDYWGNGTSNNMGNGQGAAEILRMCWNGSGFVRENDGACGDLKGANLPALLGNSPTDRAESPLFYAASYMYGASEGKAGSGVTHPYTGLGGIATLPGAPYLWSTVYDVTSAGQQGVKAFGPCAERSTDLGSCAPAAAKDGAQIGGALIDDYNADEKYIYNKGNGLGDLELACDAAPVQIGNRVWIDENKDGIQDPNEPPVQGMTAHLYNAAGTLVGTAKTDANGQYYFSSNVTQAAAGDGTNTGGGMKPGETFTVKFDNKADYAAGGPLDGYTLTKANVTKSGDAVNSKATTVGGSPTIKIPSRAIGENNHTYDAGFIKGSGLVAVGDYTWVDVNRNGVQGEQPLQGVKVTLLTTKGKRAKDAAGKSVKTKTTTARGYYVFDALKPGKYKVQFQIPAGMKFTKNSKKKSARDSNPIPTKANPQIGITPVFEVYAAVKGNTVRNKNTKLRASYIDPTIDAGVVFCAKTTLSPSTVQVGRSNRVTATVTLAGKPFAKRKVILSGNGVRMTATTNAKGVAVFTLSPDAAGSYTVRVSGESSTCQPQLLGAASGQSLTG